MVNEVKGVSVDKLNQYFRTGNKNDSRFEYKDKSLLAKMGFQDNDTKTPEHDKMIDILMDDKVLSKIANKIMIEKEFKYKDKSRTEYIIKFDSNDKWIKQEEYVVKGYNNYVVGYIDLIAKGSKIFECYTDYSICPYFREYDFMEKSAIKQCNDNNCSEDIKKSCKINDFTGFCSKNEGYRCKSQHNINTYYCNLKNVKDCSEYENICKNIKKLDIELIIEVKTKIDSIGELIRQINTYRTIINEGCFVVVSPNITDIQRKRLGESDIYLIDVKELI